MTESIEYAVVDVETTGLFPGGHDRVIEIAAIRVNQLGEPLREFVTLVNPNRDVGPTHTLSRTESRFRFPCRAGCVRSDCPSVVFGVTSATLPNFGSSQESLLS